MFTFFGALGDAAKLFTPEFIKELIDKLEDTVIDVTSEFMKLAIGTLSTFNPENMVAPTGTLVGTVPDTTYDEFTDLFLSISGTVPGIDISDESLCNMTPMAFSLIHFLNKRQHQITTSFGQFTDGWVPNYTKDQWVDPKVLLQQYYQEVMNVFFFMRTEMLNSTSENMHPTNRLSLNSEGGPSITDGSGSYQMTVAPFDHLTTRTRLDLHPTIHPSYPGLKWPMYYGKMPPDISRDTDSQLSPMNTIVSADSRMTTEGILDPPPEWVDAANATYDWKNGPWRMTTSTGTTSKHHLKYTNTSGSETATHISIGTYRVGDKLNAGTLPYPNNSMPRALNEIQTIDVLEKPLHDVYCAGHRLEWVSDTMIADFKAWFQETAQELDLIHDLGDTKPSLDPSEIELSTQTYFIDIPATEAPSADVKELLEYYKTSGKHYMLPVVGLLYMNSFTVGTILGTYGSAVDILSTEIPEDVFDTLIDGVAKVAEPIIKAIMPPLLQIAQVPFHTLLPIMANAYAPKIIMYVTKYAVILRSALLRTTMKTASIRMKNTIRHEQRIQRFKVKSLMGITRMRLSYFMAGLERQYLYICILMFLCMIVYLKVSVRRSSY